MTSPNRWSLHNAAKYNTNIQLHTVRLQTKLVRTSTSSQWWSSASIIRTRPRVDLKHEPHWNKAAVTLSLRWGGKLPIACGFTSGAAQASNLAKQPSHPKHSADSVQRSSINESDRQPTATLRIYSSLHWLSPPIKHFLDIVLYIKYVITLQCPCWGAIYQNTTFGTFVQDSIIKQEYRGLLTYLSFSYMVLNFIPFTRTEKKITFYNLRLLWYRKGAGGKVSPP